MNGITVLIIFLLLILLGMAGYVYIRCREQLADRISGGKVRLRDVFLCIIEYIGGMLGG